MYLQHQGHPDEKHHESIKHTPTIFHIGVITLCREGERVGGKNETTRAKKRKKAYKKERGQK